jgi:hypothetical protein
MSRNQLTTSPEIDENPSTMGEKKRKRNGSSEKSVGGRPKVLHPELDTRFQIRCSSKELELWEERAVALGYTGAGAWLRQVATVALRTPVK